MTDSNGAGTMRRESLRLADGATPLALKLVSANALATVIVAAACASSAHRLRPLIVVIAIAVLLIHGLAVVSMLAPVRKIQAAAVARWESEFGAMIAKDRLNGARRVELPDLYLDTMQKLEGDRLRLRTLATGLIVATENERTLVARQLFDSTAQHLAALMLELSTAASTPDREFLIERLQVAREVAATALDEVRHLAEAVHPTVLDTKGLEPALRKLARTMSHGNGIDVDVVVGPAPEPLSNIIQTVLYRTAEEAVCNAIRHGSPKCIAIKLSALELTLRLEIHDDGIGFDDVMSLRNARGGGLKGVREQVELVGGTLDIRTAVRNGTSVIALIPLPESVFDGQR
jgi:signal transduction histidine kinase